MNNSSSSPEKDWRLDSKELKLKFDGSPLNDPSEKKHGSVKEYVQAQRNLLDAFIDIDSKSSIDGSRADVGEENPAPAENNANEISQNDSLGDAATQRVGKIQLVSAAINLSLGVNIILFILKIIISITSDSASILASTLDSGLDIASGAILYLTTRIKNKKEFYKYPTGKERLEPVGIIVFACVMGVSMLGLLQEVVLKLFNRSNDSTASNSINVDLFAILVLLGTIVIKAALAVFCNYVTLKTGSISVEAYADDHRNDVISNIGVLLAAWVTYTYPSLWFIDAVFAILICIYIIYDWYDTARDQIRKLIGLSADPSFLSKVTYCAYNHSEEILKIDTVRAYHFGLRFLVECHIVLPEEMPLRMAHDIGESLEIKIEDFEDVERAFVHLDYEWEHKPEHGNPYKD